VKKILYSAFFQKILRIPDLQKMLISLLGWNFLRKAFLNWVERGIYNFDVKRNPDNRPLQSQLEKYWAGRAMLKSVDTGFSKKLISARYALGLIYNILWNVLLFGAEKRKRFLEKEGRKPPLFMTISPFAGCNLKCKGCYAGSEAALTEKLLFHILNRIISEGKELFGMNFFVISGGEPMFYRDRGKDLLDLVEMHSDCFFLSFTNGTLINREIAERMAKLGNITPAISIEGYQRETDERRGKGVHEKILRAMALLREFGVPYGVSVTANRNNIELVSSPEFFGYCFEQLNALYCWIFQYMPIGRGFDINLMPTPEQQIDANYRTWGEVREKKRFIIDFWGSGCAADGCVCAAREGGYFYIDWNGNVMPCVFIPYSTHNINEVYNNGGNLRTATIDSEFFKEIRHWQDEYGFRNPSLPSKQCYLRWKFVPCPHRHCYGELLRIVQKFGAKPINEEARRALEDKDYTRGLTKYGERVKELVL